jgi:drug/metabolite transporter (DMT)-like permease
MSTEVFIIVILAALLHAFWNAMVKGGSDKLLNMVAVVLGHIPLAFIALLFVDAPEPGSWPYLITGVFLHAGYQLFLVHAYRVGDLTQVYPIARGSAPLLVALVSVVFLGVSLSLFELLAIFTIAAGIMSICLVKQHDGVPNHGAAGLALITGCFIAAYSLVDGIGARAASTSLGYFSWLAIGNAVVMLMASLFMRPGILSDVVTSRKMVLFVGGGASYIAYALIIWSFTQAPIALVTALRETSIVFALLIGVLHLKERLSLVKVLSTMTTLTGAVMLRFAR